MIYANVGPDGVVVFEPRADPGLGRLPVGSAPPSRAKEFKRVVSALCKRDYDGVTLHVPGMPQGGVDALIRFRKLVEERMNP